MVARVFAIIVFLVAWVQAEPVPIFKGVQFEQEVRSEPRPLRLYWLEADLTAPGVSLEFSPIPDPPPAVGEILAQRPTDILKQLHWQALINGDAFHLLKTGQRYPSVGDPLDLQGIFMVNGRKYSDFIPNDGGFFRLKTGELQVGYKLPPKCQDALGGYRVVLMDGKVMPTDRVGLHPRSVVGFNNHTRRLYWLVVDGRQSGISEGATEYELGEWMKARGAESALGLDGGGSSILVIEDHGEPKILNHPVGLYNQPDTVRPIGNCLGIKALPLK